MKRHPAGAGCDDDPRTATEDRRRGDEPSWMGAVVVPFSCRRLNSPFGSLRRPECALEVLKRRLTVCGLQSVGCLVGAIPSSEITVSSSELTERSTELTERSSKSETRAVERSADVTSEAAETLRSASGGGPAASGEAAVTRDRRDRERHAVRSRGGSESAGWREVVAWCGATEGSGHE